MPIVDQMDNIIRTIVSFSILFFLFPYIIFREKGSGIEKFFSGYVKMVFLIIAAGYVLVAVKLFEFFSIFVFLILCWVISRTYLRKSQETLEQRKSFFMSIFFDLFDQRYSAEWAKAKAKEFGVLYKNRFLNFCTNPSIIVLFGVICVSAYLRFYDPLNHATPGMSDASVNLAWVKYITSNILFHDGIYPHGMHIYQATMLKFAGDDAIYIFKYTGPLNGILTILGLYLFVWKLTNRKTAGIVAAFMYGVLGFLLPLGWERQATTFPQEFGMVFLLPAWYFTLRYLETKEKLHFWNATASYAALGLIHALVYGFMALGVVLILFVYLITGFRRHIKQIIRLSLAGIASGVIAVLPILYGWLIGKTFHSTSLEYLTSEATATIPVLTTVDYLIFAIMGGTFILLLWNIFQKKRWEPYLFILFLTVIANLSYRYLGWLTGNAVIVSRISLLWAIVICISIGLGWHFIMQLLRFFKPRMEILLCIVLLVVGTVYYRPMPAVPYKMMNDSMINQYLNISNEYVPTTWMMVSNEEGYWLSLNKAWHMHLWDMLEYSPTSEKNKIVRIDEDGQEQILDTEDIFIFIEKKVFDPNLSIYEPIIAERIKNYALLEEWVDTYRENNDNIRLYYEGDDLKVYHIQQDLEV